MTSLLSDPQKQILCEKALEVERSLGAGGEGCAYLVKDLAGTKFVVKFAVVEDNHFAINSICVMLKIAASRQNELLRIVDGKADGACPFVQMEWVDGTDLSEWLRFEQRNFVAKTCILLRIASQIECLHGLGIVHCDLKPSNIIVDRRHEPKIIDFGISSLTGEPRGPCGTPIYRAPEQAGSHVCKKSIDIYSFAIIVCEVLDIDRDTMEQKHNTASVSAILKNALRGALLANPEDRTVNLHDLVSAISGHEPVVDLKFAKGIVTTRPPNVPPAPEFYAKYDSTSIVQVRHPNDHCRLEESVRDSLNGIEYDYVTCNVGRSTIFGYLFFHSEIKIQKTIHAFLERLGKSFPTELIVVTVPAFGRCGEPVDRLRSIKVISERLGMDKKKTAVVYVHELLSEFFRLPEPRRLSNTKLFVDQQVELSSSSIGSDGIEWLKSRLQASGKPVALVHGEGGAGKTWFCYQLCDYINYKSNSGRKAIYLSFDSDGEVGLDCVDGIVKLFNLCHPELARNIGQRASELNLGCGNLVIVVDGIDEVQSRLGDRFDLDRFMHSIFDIQEELRDCFVILTCRTFGSLRFREFPQVDVIKLKGFDASGAREVFGKLLLETWAADCDTDLPGAIEKACNLLTSLDVADESGRFTPLVLSLVAEISGDRLGYMSADTKYLRRELSMDRLLVAIIGRELVKQAIPFSVDQYVEILGEIAFSNKGEVSPDYLSTIIESSISIDEDSLVAVRNGLSSSPLLQLMDGLFRFRHPSIEIISRSRYFYGRLKEGVAGCDAELQQFALMAYGESDVFSEFRRLIGVDRIENGKAIVMDLVNKAREKIVASKNLHKTVSGMIHFAVLIQNASHRENFSDMLVDFFGSEVAGVAIMGIAPALDFTKVRFRNCKFESYSALQKSKFPDEGVVFENCEFIACDSFEEGIPHHVFAKNCSLDARTKRLLFSEADRKKYNFSSFVSDARRILKVGFKNGMFSWKSEQMYRNAFQGLHRGVSGDSLIAKLVRSGIMEKRREKAGSGFGFVINERFSSEVRELCAGNVCSGELKVALVRLFENH